VEPAHIKEAGKHRLARALNISLIFLIIWGLTAEFLHRIGKSPLGTEEILRLVVLGSLGLSYFLNRSGYFYPAIVLTIVALSAATFTMALIQHFSNEKDLSVLYYLIIVILMSELFFSMRGFVLVTVSILAGTFIIYLLNENSTSIFLFLLIFSALVDFASYNRRLAETERIALATQSAYDQSQLLAERHYAHQMELLNQITNTTLQTPNLRQALQTLADQLGQILEADGAFITFWKEDVQQVLPASAYGDFRETYPKIKIEPGETTLTAAVLREGRAIPVEDVHHTPYMHPRLAADVPTRSALGLPLIANDLKLGAAILSFNEPHQFTAEEIAIGEQAAKQIALAIFRVQLFDKESRRARQLELLEEVGRRIADSFDQTEILQRALEAVVDKFGYAEAAISLLTKDDFLEVAAITGTEDFGYRPGYRQEMGKGIIGHVAQLREPYIAGDVASDPYYFSSAWRQGSAVGIPMLDKDQLLGVIYVESTKQSDFTAEDVQTLQTFANQVATSLQKARLYATTQQHLHVMTTLQSVSHVVTSSLELDEILNNVLELLKVSFGYTYISIYLLDGDRLQLGAELGYPQDLIISEIPITIGIVGRAVRTRLPQYIEDVNKDESFLRASSEIKSEICVPLLRKDHVLGVLNVESKEEDPLDERDVNLLTALAGPLAIAIDNARLHAEVKTMALTDILSGLANRRAFDDILHTEVMRATRYNNELSLIILDLDSFKEFNDQYGHPAGDVRLKEIGDMLRENVREPDLAARYGGEEFAVILPNTSKLGAMRLAERLRACAERRASGESHVNHVIAGYTISLGVATFPEDASTLNDLLIAADNAELMAKRLGKNRVSAAS
jgi:diguanylate cyclase (GGDEF)-like protein